MHFHSHRCEGVLLSKFGARAKFFDVTKFIRIQRQRNTRDRQTDTQNDYCNPRCACAPRVNNLKHIKKAVVQTNRGLIIGQKKE